MRRLHFAVTPLLAFVLAACSSDGGTGGTPATDGGAGSGGSTASTGGSDSGGGTGTATGGKTSGSGGKTGGSGGQASGGATGGSGGTTTTMDASAAGVPFGPVHDGSYNIGPVDFVESVWHNSCAPYAPQVQSMTGNLLGGVDNAWNGDGSLCDSCALLKTRMGKEVIVRIVTTGVSKAVGDMDLSPEAYDLIHVDDPQGTPDLPRPFSWQLVRCPDTGNLFIQYQTGANEWWTSLWVRNGALPIAKLEVKSANHASFFAMRKETDGTFNDDGGFGAGKFELRITPENGEAVTVSFDGFTPGALVDTGVQFP